MTYIHIYIYIYIYRITPLSCFVLMGTFVEVAIVTTRVV
jgi:hypothetical protein